MTADRTMQLLQQWHQGDSRALEELLQDNLPFIKEYIGRRLGPELRRKADPTDLMQDAMVEVLRYGPRFLLADRNHFRALMGRIIENVIRDKHDWFRARRRDLHRERPLPEGSVLGLDLQARSVTRPSQAVGRHQDEAWIRLALELLSPEERRCIHLRVFEGLGYAELGKRLGLTGDAARMRFNRAMPRLATVVARLRAGELDQVLERGTSGSGPGGEGA